MGERAARGIYAGTGPVSQHELKRLGYIEHCERNPAARGFLVRYDHHQARMHDARVAAAQAAAAAQSPAAQGYTQSRQSSQSGASSSSHQSGSGGWSIPSSVVQCESGGTNAGPNGSGASGYYQIIPSTWQAYGGGQYAPSAYQATAAQQAAIAAKIWNGGAGASQWSCAG
jgi:hypothetical protein